ncbi:MAG TPA: 4-(cytidine 5'-diphospho)-2-C-methyl-D-erythritol kinase [Acidimicrobiales bacterium]|nr:4-(cytidine 5'-diphospho)-2-C-methyl-D-erythritol kinase [Acidimicrobiales bacterium]
MSELLAPAKLTWYLEVTRRRDDGFHELRSEMVTLDFADRLDVDESGDYLRLEGPFSAVPLDDHNLVTRALELVERRAGVTLHKVIPPGGGLGGGSADAGAILRWAGGVSAEKALSLGGDVPFCQMGGRALVEGVGERLTTLPYEPRDVTLVLLGFGVNTRQCYEAYDELVAAGEKPEGRNHLEAAARLVEPRLAETMDWLGATLENRVHLAGSGSTLFIEGHLEHGVETWDVLGPEGVVQFRQTITTPTGA